MLDCCLDVGADLAGSLAFNPLIITFLLPRLIELILDVGADLAGSLAFNPLIVILRVGPLTGNGLGNLTGTGSLATTGALITTDIFLGAGLGAALLGARIDASFCLVKNISMIIE